VKIQLEQLDLTQPWPKLVLKDGYHSMRILVRLGSVPIGDVMVRPTRRRVASHRGLRKRIANKHAYMILRVLSREGLSAGAELMTKAPAGASFPSIAGNHWQRARDFVQDELLRPQGLPTPYRQWVIEGQSKTPFECPAVTVVVCTRDRAQQLQGCIAHLKSLEYPSFEILICDNSASPTATQAVCEKMDVDYVREPVAGLSRARNTVLKAARTRWVAFTDDDCRPEKNWLKELVRPLQDGNCGGVCGLVLPAQLENSAEITFEIYGGLGRGYATKIYDRGWMDCSRTKPPQTWRIGAGANMLLDRDLVMQRGGYDEDMGPGGVGGCGEDTLVFYQILHACRTIHYTPNAIVHHYHRSSDPALRKHILSYAIGHSAYHWKLLFKYRDVRSLIQLCWHLPIWFARNLRRAIRGKTSYPFSLVFLEIKGTMLGPIQYTKAKLVKWATRVLVGESDRPPLLHVSRKQEREYGDVTGEKRARVA